MKRSNNSAAGECDDGPTKCSGGSAEQQRDVNAVCSSRCWCCSWRDWRWRNGDVVGDGRLARPEFGRGNPSELVAAPPRLIHRFLSSRSLARLFLLESILVASARTAGKSLSLLTPLIASLIHRTTATWQYHSDLLTDNEQSSQRWRCAACHPSHPSRLAFRISSDSQPPAVLSSHTWSRSQRQSPDELHRLSSAGFLPLRYIPSQKNRTHEGFSCFGYFQITMQ